MAEGRVKLIRVMHFFPKCACGDDMTELEDFCITETGFVQFIGTCEKKCKTNVTEVNVRRTVAEIKKQKIEGLPRQRIKGSFLVDDEEEGEPVN